MFQGEHHDMAAERGKKHPEAPDPFGNLRNWGPVLDLLDRLDQTGRMEECQPGLIRILRYRGNWRLREETLKRLGRIAHPSRELIARVADIIADDDTYYEARILAGRALAELAQNARRTSAKDEDPDMEPVADVVRNLLGTPQPPIFDQALRQCLNTVC